VLMLFFGLLFGALVLGWRAATGMLRRLTVQRRTPESISAGDLLVMEIEASNTARRAGCWSVTVEDALRREAPEPAEPIRARLLFPYVPAGTSRRLAYQGRLAERGRYVFDALRVATGFPLGLLRHTLTIEQPAAIIVWPRLGRLSAQWDDRRREATTGYRQVRRPHGSREGDYHALRNWRPGDSRRWIHWRTTARVGDLMVRQFEQQRDYDLVLLVELWQPAIPEPRHRATVERAVRFAATLVAQRCRQGPSRLVVGLAGNEPELAGGPASQGVFRHTMDRLAVAAPTTDDQALPRLAKHAFETLLPGTDVVLVSTRPVDLNDTERFSVLWSDPRLREWVGEVMVLDAASDELALWFDPLPAEEAIP
jgi:uncharacterized protein (DUF58 family)